METIYMKREILFSRKNKKISRLSSAELALSMVKSNFIGSNIFGTIENCSRHG